MNEWKRKDFKEKASSAHGNILFMLCNSFQGILCVIGCQNTTDTHTAHRRQRRRRHLQIIHTNDNDDDENVAEAKRYT